MDYGIYLLYVDIKEENTFWNIRKKKLDGAWMEPPRWSASILGVVPYAGLFLLFIFSLVERKWIREKSGTTTSFGEK